MTSWVISHKKSKTGLKIFVGVIPKGSMAGISSTKPSFGTTPTIESYSVVFTDGTLFSKKNATFLKLPFFSRRVYTRESGVIHLYEWRGSYNIILTMLSDSGAPGEMDRLKLRFLWKRVYFVVHVTAKEDLAGMKPAKPSLAVTTTET